jgi:hypothetical protein
MENQVNTSLWGMPATLQATCFISVFAHRVFPLSHSNQYQVNRLAWQANFRWSIA